MKTENDKASTGRGISHHFRREAKLMIGMPFVILFLGFLVMLILQLFI